MNNTYNRREQEMFLVLKCVAAAFMPFEHLLLVLMLLFVVVVLFL
jgi:hypothetical protein